MPSIQSIKWTIKKMLARLGILHPALSVKIMPDAKAREVLACKRPEVSIFVETGTEFGTMIQNLGNAFTKIYSVELDPTLYEAAVTKFAGRSDVILRHGNSITELPQILKEIHEPAVFWLDAHGSGAMTVKKPEHCPVREELEAIIAHGVAGHTILIDDARHFDRYSIGVIKDLAKRGGYRFSIKNGLFYLQ